MLVLSFLFNQNIMVKTLLLRKSLPHWPELRSSPSLTEDNPVWSLLWSILVRVNIDLFKGVNGILTIEEEEKIMKRI